MRRRFLTNERTTIDSGEYHVWTLSEPISSASLPSDDDVYIFSYEFVVEQGPAIVLAATTSDSLKRRETDGHYRVWGGTRTQGQQGATSKSMPKALLELLVADNQYIGSETPPPNRSAATVHVQAYISTPKQS